MWFNHSSRLLATNMFVCLFVVGLGFELRALHLQSRGSTTSDTTSVHFALVIRKMGSPELFAWADTDLDLDLSLPRS
jgi:hypothetical protein